MLNSIPPSTPPSSVALVFAIRGEIKPILKESRILSEILMGPTILSKVEFRGSPLLLCQTGIGLSAAHEGTERLLGHFQPSRILSVGYAGGADPSLKTGDLVIPAEIRSETPTDHFKTDPKGREMLVMLSEEERIPYKIGPLLTLWKVADGKEKAKWGEKGALAVDMETAAVAAVAAKKKIPFLSLRVIFDTPTDELPFPKETPRSSNLLPLLLKNPRAILEIPRFFRMHQACQRNLIKVVARFIDCFA